MRRGKWRGTILFVVILTVMGLTIGLRLYGVGHVGAASSVVAAAPPSTPAPTRAAPAATPTSAATPSAAATPPPAAPAVKVVTGTTEDTPYGPIQIRVTFDGTKITSVDELQSPNDERRSVEINSSAAPILRQEILASQSARIDSVSGATYTSDGYAKSVQSAIDQL